MAPEFKSSAASLRSLSPGFKSGVASKTRCRRTPKRLRRKRTRRLGKMLMAKLQVGFMIRAMKERPTIAGDELCCVGRYVARGARVWCFGLKSKCVLKFCHKHFAEPTCSFAAKPLWSAAATSPRGDAALTSGRQRAQRGGATLKLGSHACHGVAMRSRTCHGLVMRSRPCHGGVDPTPN